MYHHWVLIKYVNDLSLNKFVFFSWYPDVSYPIPSYVPFLPLICIGTAKLREYSHGGSRTTGSLAKEHCCSPQEVKASYRITEILSGLVLEMRFSLHASQLDARKGRCKKELSFGLFDGMRNFTHDLLHSILQCIILKSCFSHASSYPILFHPFISQ